MSELDYTITHEDIKILCGEFNQTSYKVFEKHATEKFPLLNNKSFIEEYATALESVGNDVPLKQSSYEFWDKKISKDSSVVWGDIFTNVAKCKAYDFLDKKFENAIRNNEVLVDGTKGFTRIELIEQMCISTKTNNYEQINKLFDRIKITNNDPLTKEDIWNDTKNSAEKLLKNISKNKKLLGKEKISISEKIQNFKKSFQKEVKEKSRERR